MSTACCASPLPLVLLGAGGHARVLLALARAADHEVVGVCDPALAAEGAAQWLEVPVLGGDEAVAGLDASRVGLINGIGQLVGSLARRNLYQRMTAAGHVFPALIHPAAWVAPDVVLEGGVQVMAGAVVQPGCRIGENSIINTRAGVDHDCRIGAHVHIAPGATLCGGVQVGDDAFIGAGALLIQGIHVGERAVLGAGASLVKDLAADLVFLGAAGRLRPPSA